MQTEVSAVKAWLLRARKLEYRLAALHESRQRMYERAVHCTSSPQKNAGRAGQQNLTEQRMTAYASACETFDQQIQQLEQVRNEIFQTIMQVEDNRLNALLIEYYINTHSWETVAELLNYTPRHVIRLHQKALEAVRLILERNGWQAGQGTMDLASM